MKAKQIIFAIIFILFTFSTSHAKYTEADLDSVKKKVNDNPDNAQNYYNLGVIYNDLNRNNEAVDAYKKAVELKKDYIDAHYNLGVTYGNLNMTTEAFDAFKSVVFIDPNNFEGNFGLANVYKRTGLYDEAIKFYKKAIEIKRASYESCYNLGLTYEVIEKFSEAEAAYKQAIEIKPDYEKALNKLVEIQVSKTKKQRTQNNYLDNLKNAKKPLSKDNLDTSKMEEMQNPADQPVTPTGNEINYYAWGGLIVFVFLMLLFFLFIPAFFLMIGSVIANIEKTTYMTAILATIASVFIFYFVALLAIPNFNVSMSIGLMVGFILSIISIQAIYETTFGKALVAWIFGTITMVIAQYVTMFILFYFAGSYMNYIIPENIHKNIFFKKIISSVSKDKNKNIKVDVK